MLTSTGARTRLAARPVPQNPNPIRSAFPFFVFCPSTTESPTPTLLFAEASCRQGAHQRTHHRHLLLAARQALAHQVVRRHRQVPFLQRHIGAKAIEERQLEVRRLAQRTVWADLYTVTAEDTAIQRERVAFQRALGHHQRPGRTDLHTGATRDAVRIVQADIERRGDNRVEAFAEHTVAVGTNHVMADAHALRTVDALVGIAQDEAVRQVQLVVVIIARLTVMEAVIRQAMLEAVLLQVTLPGGRAGALQTPRRLPLRLLGQVA